MQRIRHNFARAYAADSQYDKAEPLFRDSLERLVAAYKARRGQVTIDEIGHMLNNLATFYYDLGQYGRAVQTAKESLELFQSNGWTGPASMVRDNLGNIYRAMKQYDQALASYEAALKFRRQQFGDSDPRTAVVLNNIAGVYFDQKKFVEAEKLFRRCLELSERAGGRDSDPMALANLAMALEALGRYPEAEELYLRHLHYVEQHYGPKHPYAARCYNWLAVVAAYTDRWDRAVALMDRSRRDLKSNVMRIAAGLSESEQSTFLPSYTGDTLSAALSIGWARRQDPAAVECALGWLLNSKGLLYEAMAERGLLARDARLTGQGTLIAELRAVRRKLADRMNGDIGKASPEQYKRELASLVEREADLSRRLGQAGGHVLDERPWVLVSDVRKTVPADSVLIEVAQVNLCDFAVRGGPAGPKIEPHYLAWVVPGEAAGPVQLVDLGNVSEVDTLAGKLFDNFKQLQKQTTEFGAKLRKLQAENLSPAELEKRRAVLRREFNGQQRDLEKAYRAASAEVSKRVLEPLRPHAGKAKHWVISPDADLWLVPWAALVLEDGKYLIEEHTLRYVVSGSDLLADRSAYGGPVDPPLVLANPNYDRGVNGPESRARDVTPLVFTETEAKWVLPFLETYAKAKPKVRLRDDAREEEVKSAHSPRVLFLSTHGSFGKIDPAKIRPGFGYLVESPLLRSALYLAGCNRKPIPGDSGDDGILLGIEVLDCDLRGTEVVVLSACETAQGDVHAGQSAAGLRQAFQLAGARAVVATLWSVDALASALVTKAFCANLATGRSKADALCTAQRDTMATLTQERGVAHPFYWATFTLTGRDR